MTVWVAMSLVTLMGFAGLAIDLGYAYTAKAELQHAADSSALAATASLAEIYRTMPFKEQAEYQLTALDRKRIMETGDRLSVAHKAAGQSIALLAADVEIGGWSFDQQVLETSGRRPSAVRVRSQRSDQSNGPVSTFLSQVIGVNSLNVASGACAALTPLGAVDESQTVLPIGISRAWFASLPDSCDQPIRFHPTGDLLGCAGWHTYQGGTASAAALRSILQGLTDGSFDSPPVRAGETVQFTGGTVSSAFPDMKALYEARRFDEAPFDEFEGVVVVYDRLDCSNPSGALTVAGFASVIITGVQEAPEKIIDAVVKCGITVAGNGGGEDFGTQASTPSLVE